MQQSSRFQQRLVLIIAILTSFIPFSSESMITVLLPVIERELGGGLVFQQWAFNGYLITLGSFILIAGSLSDLFGRLKIARYGLVGFGIASLLCAIAPNAEILIAARLLQGEAGALLLPGSLALIAEFITGENFSKAIGSRTAWTSIAFVLGPLLGGLFVDSGLWRLAFAAYVIPVAITLWLIRRLPERSPPGKAHIDILGSLLCVSALGGIVFALTEQAKMGWSHPLILASLGVGILSLTGFILREMRYRHPMLPVRLFLERNFTVGNIVTFTVYGGLTAWGFVIALYLQQVAGYSALASGLSTLPVTIIMFLCSSRVGTLYGRFGARKLVSAGSLMAAAGIALLALNMQTNPSYITDILPGMIIFGLGVTITATPLTTTVLSAVPNSRSGVASAVNNAVVSISGLLTIAAIGIVLAAQFSGVIENRIAHSQLSPQSHQALQDIKEGTPRAAVPAEVTHKDAAVAQQILREASVGSFRSGMLFIAVLVGAGALIGVVGIRRTPSP